MNLVYLAARIIRHFLPEQMTRAMLRRGLVIKPGLETREPAQAAARYQKVLTENGMYLKDKHVLVFGYGGRYAIGVELLRLGARKVTLTDLFAPPDDRRNHHLLPEFRDYLIEKDGLVRPRGDELQLIHDDIRKLAIDTIGQEYDGIVSTSVYEHLDDVGGITRALSHVLKPGGFFIAYIDLRDHFFRYPFEMLKYSETTLKKWLNPTSNLNRFRLKDYQEIFAPQFSQTAWQVLERNLDEYRRSKPHIRPEFFTGDDEMDSVTQAMVFAVR
jgi:hypothetical protein